MPGFETTPKGPRAPQGIHRHLTETTSLFNISLCPILLQVLFPGVLSVNFDVGNKTQDTSPGLSLETFNKLTAVVLVGGDFAPRGDLTWSGDISGCLYRAGLQMSREKRLAMLLNILQCTRQSSTTKNYLTPLSMVSRLRNPR